MSVNILQDPNIGNVYKSAELYFKEKSTRTLHKLVLYQSEGDMHSGKNCMGVFIITYKENGRGKFFCHDSELMGRDRCEFQCKGCKEWF